MDGPVTIATVTRPTADEEYDGIFRIHMKELNDILMKPEVKDLPACVYAIVGPYRAGKSFMINYFLRHVQAKGENVQNTSALGDEDKELTGFSWKPGSDPDTNGIAMWGRPLILTRKTDNEKPDIEKVAVILVDTQGLCDGELNETEEDLLFAVNAIISKTLIYNIRNTIDQERLRGLQRAVKATSPNEKGKLLQETVLITLVRDCFFTNEFGLDGGEKELKKILERANSKELQETRETLESAFQELKCYLMPFIGTIAAKAESGFNGCLKDLDKDFQVHLKKLVEHLFSEELLKPKQIAGQPMTCEDVYKALAIFNEKVLLGKDKLPTGNEAFQEIELDKMIRMCVKLYKQQMDKVFARGNPHLSKMKFDKKNEEFTEDALKILMEMSDDEAQTERAKKSIEDLYEEYSLQNDANSTDKKVRGVALAKEAYEGEMTRVLGNWNILTTEEYNKLQRLAKAIALARYDKNVPKQAAQMVEGRNEVVEYCDRNEKKYRRKNNFNSRVQKGAKFVGGVAATAVGVGAAVVAAPVVVPMIAGATATAGAAAGTAAAAVAGAAQSAGAVAAPILAAAGKGAFTLMRTIRR